MRVRLYQLALSCLLITAGTVQAQPGASLQPLFQALHDHSYDGGAYEGMFTATPQQLIDRVDPQTVQQLAEASSALAGNPRDVGNLVLRSSSALNAARQSIYRDSWLHFAAQDLESALKLDPNNFIAHHNYAQTCLEVGDVNGGAQPVMHLAVSQFTKAIALKPDSARSYMGRGWAYLMLRDQANASTDFQKALQLDPSLRPQLEQEAIDIERKLGQLAAAQQMLQAMGSYRVDHTARTAGDCAAKKGFWTHNECRFTDLGLHQGLR